MEAIKCNRGHFYDKALGSCPICAAEASSNRSPFITDSNVPDTIPATAPTGMNFDIPSTVPSTTGFDIPSTIPATTPGFAPTELGTPIGGSDFDLDAYPVTSVAGSYGEEPFDPVVGWLICVKGPNRGKDYRLHSGTNFIGRGKQSDICIDSDQAISTRNHASVSYDEREKVFYITKGEVRNPTYLNGKALRSDADLVIYDHIEIGNTELVFVPLCGEQFNWQDF